MTKMARTQSETIKFGGPANMHRKQDGNEYFFLGAPRIISLTHPPTNVQ